MDGPQTGKRYCDAMNHSQFIGRFKRYDKRINVEQLEDREKDVRVKKRPEAGGIEGLVVVRVASWARTWPGSRATSISRQAVSARQCGTVAPLKAERPGKESLLNSR